MTKEISKVAVIGLGTMGAGIAEVFAKGGYAVRGIEYNDAALDRGRAILQKSTGRAVKRGKMSEEDAAALIGRIQFSTDNTDVSDCDLVIEAVNENPELKASIFRVIDEAAPEHAILATNTSSLSITAIAAVTKNPSRVVGVHFFNPAPVQKLVEVIRTLHTADEHVDRLIGLLRSLGKEPILCRDRAGFIVNALLIPYLSNAVRLYEEHYCTREELDSAMVEQAGYPMGPLQLCDLVGNDVALAVLERMYEETKDRRNAPPALLTSMVEAGLLGNKSGRGFYTYDEKGATDDPGPVSLPRQTRGDELPLRLVAPYLNEALRMVQTGYAIPNDIDTGMQLGCRMPGPFQMLAEIGPKEVLTAQQAVFAETAEPGDKPVRLLEQLAYALAPASAVQDIRDWT
ncbi:3-hydroxyacyl-CoA dehydrogenase [Granulicoccus phenolivorans]|uniref:3-hydroxyacyl-CoA dehydrogenase n=1 Tax=Granulicoccus phenolivorans TaxID=266854 RepID=UPI0009DC3493|nr:3-hydroxyacyl-CoA dehydrogenase [Granulicoccus phenolivorans]